MNTILYLQFFLLFTVEWASRVRGYLPSYSVLVIDLVSAFTFVILFVIAVGHRRFDITNALGVFLIIFALGMIGSVVTNDVSAAPIVAGIRTYLKYVPFLLLPIIYEFSEKQIRSQLTCLFVLILAQTPMAFYQKFVEFWDGGRTGDAIGGTIGPSASGILTYVLCCTIAVVMTAALRSRLRWSIAFLIVIFLAAPIALNETKVAMVILPIVLIGPVALSGTIGQRIRNFSFLGLFSAALIGTLVVSYDYFNTRTMLEFWSDRDQVAFEIAMGTHQYGGKVRRLDSVRFAYLTIQKEGKLLFGVGIGNASQSAIDGFEGDYYNRYWRMRPGQVYLSRIIWEFGLFGVLILIVFLGGIIQAALKVRHNPDLTGLLAQAWIPITAILIMSLVYFRTFEIDVIGFIYWFYSGHICAKAARLKQSDIQKGATPQHRFASKLANNRVAADHASQRP